MTLAARCMIGMNLRRTMDLLIWAGLGRVQTYQYWTLYWVANWKVARQDWAVDKESKRILSIAPPPTIKIASIDI